MASRPKLQRFRAAMARIAEREGFTGSEAPLLWALSEIEAGVPVAQLWKIVQGEAGETSVRGWAYTALYALAPDARQRVKEARRIGAYTLVDEALEISDRPASSAAEAASNRLAVDTRFRVAGIFNREELGDNAPRAQVSVSIGQLHVDAMRQRLVAKVEVPREISDGSADYEAVPSGESENEE